jgi:hypothetical protein
MNNRASALLVAVVTGMTCAAVLPLRIAAAENTPQQIFARGWEGKSIVLKQVLYTLVYNERGKLGNTRNGRREGLMVATPSSGAYLQFDGRQGKDAVVEKQPQQMFEAVNAAYMPDNLDVRSYRKVEAVVVHRYSVGTELFVSRLRVDRDSVRVAFVQLPTADPNDDPATSLTIKWPVPFNKTFSESALVDDLIRQFVDVKPAS